MSDHRSAPAGTTERSFVSLCADEAAFAAWYGGALPRVYGFVYGRCGGDSTLAEDVTAQAFFEAVRARQSFDGRSDPVTWVCSIARNRLMDRYRQRSRERTRHLQLVVEEVAIDGSPGMDHVEERDVVLSVLATIPASERMALTLRYLDGYSVRETASLIGRSEAATESLLMRARERVRAAFPGGPV